MADKVKVAEAKPKNGKKVCKECNGTGFDAKAERQCAVCDGKGK